MENQPGGEGQASDQSATASGMLPHHMSRYTSIFMAMLHIFCHIYSVIVTLAFFSSEDTEDIE